MEEERKNSEFREWMIAIIITLIVAILLRNFIFVLARVKGASMEPTLYEDHRLFVSKASYWANDPDYEDIVIIDISIGTEYVKRVVGKGGDTIEIRDSVVYRNGVAIEEDYLAEGVTYQDFELVTVPEGHYFVMGDNRPRSKDSRSADVGFIAREKIEGKVVCIIWPFSEFGSPYHDDTE